MRIDSLVDERNRKTWAQIVKDDYFGKYNIYPSIGFHRNVNFLSENRKMTELDIDLYFGEMGFSLIYEDENFINCVHLVHFFPKKGISISVLKKFKTGVDNE